MQICVACLEPGEFYMRIINYVIQVFLQIVLFNFLSNFTIYNSYNLLNLATKHFNNKIIHKLNNFKCHNSDNQTGLVLFE